MPKTRYEICPARVNSYACQTTGRNIQVGSARLVRLFLEKSPFRSALELVEKSRRRLSQVRGDMFDVARGVSFLQGKEERERELPKTLYLTAKDGDR